MKTGFKIIDDVYCPSASGGTKAKDAGVENLELYYWEDKAYHGPEERKDVYANKKEERFLHSAIKKATEESSGKYVEVYSGEDFVGSSRNGGDFIYGGKWKKKYGLTD